MPGIIGRIRRHSFVQAMLAGATTLGMAGLWPTTGAAVTIDSFTTNQAPVADPPGGATSVAGPASEIIGARRGLSLRRLSGAGPISALVTGGLASLTVSDTSPDSRGEATFTWDGDADPNVLTPSGLGGQDLTAGAHTGFAVVITSASTGAELVLVTHTDASNASQAARRLSAIAVSTTVFLPFSAFQPIAGTGADFTSVGAIELIVRGPEGAVEIDLIETRGASAAGLPTTKIALDTNGVPIGATPQLPGTTLRYRVTLTNTGSEAQDVSATDTLGTNLALVPGTVDSSPIAREDQYRTPGNLGLTIAAPGLLGNDGDPDGDGVSVASIGGIATALGGMVTVAADGSFSYAPPAGVGQSVDTFEYTISDGGTKTGSATATIHIGPTIWFVDNANCSPAPCGLGTFSDPFGGLAQAQTASAPGDTIFVFAGSGSYPVGIVLQDDQRLIGEGVALVVNGTALVPAGAPPTITCAGGNCLTLAADNTLHGLIVAHAGAGGTKIAGSNFGTLNVDEVTLNGSGRALGLTTGAIEGVFVDIDVSSGSLQGIALDGVGGNWSVNGQVSIGNVGGTAVSIINSPAGGVDFDGGLSITKASSGAGIHFDGNAAPIDLNAVSITTGAGPAVTVNNSSGVVTIASGSAAATGGPALSSLGSTVDIVLTGASSTNSPAEGIRLDTMSGTVTFSGATTITSATPSAFPMVRLSNNTGATINFSGSASLGDGATPGSAPAFLAEGGGNLSLNGAFDVDIVGGRGFDIDQMTLSGTMSSEITTSGAMAGPAIEITNSAAPGGITFGQTLSLSASANGGIRLQNNTGTFDFPNLAEIDNSNGVALSALNAGTINVGHTSTGPVANAAGVTIDVQNTSVGTHGIVVERVDSSGGANGIILANTGTNPALTVQGSGTAGSGGVITNKTGDGIRLENTRGVTLNFITLSSVATTDGPGPCGTNLVGNTGCNAAIDLASVSDITLNGLSITGDPQYGVNGYDVAGFSLSNSTISGAGNQGQEDGIRFIDLTGTVLIRNTTLQNSHDNHLRVYNTVDTPLSLTVEETVAGTSRFLSTVVNDAILFEGINDANMTLSVSNTDFDSSEGDHIQTAINDAATMDITIRDNTMTVTADPAVPGSGITLSSGADFTGLKTFDISGNTINRANGNAHNINVNLGTQAGTGSYIGSVLNNTLGTSGVAMSGGAGMQFIGNGLGTMTARADGNIVQQFDSDAGIRVLHRDGNGRLNLTLTNNTVRLPEPGGFNGVSVQSGGIPGPPVDAGTICLDINGNTLVGSGAGGSSSTDFRLRQRFDTTFQLRGYGGAPGDTAAVVAFVQGLNPGGETGSATTETTPPAGTGFINTPAGAACPSP